MLSGLLATVFPWRCVHCGRGGERFCPACAGALEVAGPACCRRCGRPGIRETSGCPECRGRRLWFGSARAAFRYEGPARSLVHALKYCGLRRLAVDMAALTLTHAAGLTGYLEGATLTYVPLHESRRLNRGYNQAGLYARALSQELGGAVGDFLIKKRPTVPQNQLDLKGRTGNLKGSIVLRPGRHPRSSRLVLVDDVYTTGSTVSECARVLKQGLGVDVDVLVFARTVRSQSLVFHASRVF